MKLVSVDEMKQLEAAANAHGFSYEMMMLKAGNELARVVHKRYSADGNHQVVGLVGSGNNGGDTLVALSSLSTLGWSATAILFKPRSEDDKLLQTFLENGGIVLDTSSRGTERKVKSAVESAHVILDGVLGTGFKLPLSLDYARLLGEVKKSIASQVIVAVDCPSGVDCDSGESSKETLEADLTVCMEAVKQGLVRLPAFLKCGELLTVDLGILKAAKLELGEHKKVADSELAASLLPLRSRTAHKGSFGTVMVIGGSVNYTGAPILAGQSAYRVGAGLVQMAIPASIQPQVCSSLLEAIWLLLDDEMGAIAESAFELVSTQMEKVTCFVLGPGMGRDDTTVRFVKRLLMGSAESPAKSMGFVPVERQAPEPQKLLPPFVIDADGLRILSTIPDWSKYIQGIGVLTPHPGEMAALTGLTVEEVQKNREDIAVHYSHHWNQVVVLKGALTVIANPDGNSVIIPVASSALAKAGSGDVLSGAIAGFMAQGISAFSAAVAGSWYHAQAGLAAADQMGSERSVMAGDLIQAFPSVLR